MNFSGETLLHAPQEDAWEALLNPEALRHCLPGCQKLEPMGPDAYEATVTLGIGAVKGTYTGHMRIDDQEPPHRYTLSVEGAGSSGSVRGTGSIALSPNPEGTAVSWSADVQIGGPIASVGQRLMSGVAKLVAGDFFKCIDRHLAQGRSEAEGAGQREA